MATPRPQQPTPASAGTFTLVSGAFTDGAAIPVRYTCDGAGVSPPLEWRSAPAGTAAFVLLVEDPDARGFVHWVVGPIPAMATGLPEGTGPTDPPQGRNGFGKPGWGGPCPPSGTHHYLFRLAALPAGVTVAGPITADAARWLLSSAAAVAQLTGTYTRR
jgi:Raf kinase inhibitor-like YbhB/YbcL family protein